MGTVNDDLRIYYLASEYSHENADELIDIYMNKDGDVNQDVAALLRYVVIDEAAKQGHRDVVKKIESIMVMEVL